MQKLTDAFVGSLGVTSKETWYADKAISGLYLRVTAAGSKLYVARINRGGKKVYATLGRAEDIKAADARKLAIPALEALRAGRDPAAERKARQRAEAAGQVTVQALGERWMREIVVPKRKPRTASDYQRLLDQRIGPTFGHMVVSEVQRSDVIAWHAGMADIPRRANYSLAVFKALMGFAEDVGLRAPHTNPCRRIEMYREGRRERFMSEAEIAKAADAIARAEADGKIGPHAAAGLRLALFTGARSGEITAAKWEHLDRGRRVIRLPDSKTNMPRDIYLSDAAMEVIAVIPRVGPYIIAGAKPGEGFKNLGRSWIVARKYAGLDDVRLHDLRHSYASLAAGRGVSLQMIGRLLGHKVAATTQRYAHLARDAVAAVNDELGQAMTSAIEAGVPEGSNVIKMKRRGRRKS